MPCSPRRTVLILTALVLALSGCTGMNEADAPRPREVAASEPAPRPPEKKAEPDTDMPKAFALNGEPVKLTDLKGKVVLLDFWAVWCGYCIEAFPHLRDWHKEFAGQGLEVVGATTYWGAYHFDKVSGRVRKEGRQVVNENTGERNRVGFLTPAEERDMVKDFAAHHDLRYRLLIYSPAAWSQINRDLRISGYPTVVLFDRKGQPRATHVGGGEQTARRIEADLRKLLAEN
jgi:thiol-disulfide isomerase/thioredoxin